MLKKWLSFYTAIVIIVVLLAGMTPVLAEEDETAISWMCVGDSITYGNKVPGGYRAVLYDLYKENGINLRMVGPNSTNNGEGLLPDGSGHAGYGGYYIREISNRIIPWLESYQPQVVSLQIGTNDMLMNKTGTFPDDTRDTAPNRLSELIDKITTTLPEAEVFVAKIPPLNSSGYNPHVVKYNESVETVVSSKGSKVHLVDNYTALNDDKAANLQDDGIHPNLIGYQKMAKSWFDASKSVVSGITPTEAQQLRATARTGEYMLHLASPGGAGFKNAMTKKMTLEKNTDYDVEFYIKGDTGTTILARAAANSNYVALKNSTAECGPNWSKASFSFNTGEYTEIYFILFENSATAGDIYIDDCSLVKSGTTENLIVNPSFEEQKDGWSLNSIFEVLSQNYLAPPAAVETDGPKDILKEDHITMDDEFDSKGGAADITAEMIAASKFYTKPDEITTDYVATSNQEGRNGIYYKDNAGKGYIMINTNGSDQTALFKLDKAGHRDFTGFDEIKIKCKMMKLINAPDTHYTGDWSKLGQYYLDVTLGDLKNYSERINSKTVKLKPTNFATLEDDVWEEYVIKRSEFAGGALDMNGKLGRYDDGVNHDMTIAFKAKSRGAWLIDEISFIWYDNEPTASITELNFTNNGQTINAYGLQNGENTLTATLHNTTSANLNNANLFYVLYNKKAGRPESVKCHTINLDGGKSEDASLSVTIPENASRRDYEVRIIMMDNSMKPMLVDVYKFDSNGVVIN